MRLKEWSTEFLESDELFCTERLDRALELPVQFDLLLLKAEVPETIAHVSRAAVLHMSPSLFVEMPSMKSKCEHANNCTLKFYETQ